MRVLGMLKADLRCAFLNWRFIAAVFGVALVTAPLNAGSDTNVVTLFCAGSDFSTLITLFAAVPFLSSYVDDRSYGRMSSLLLRISGRRYAAVRFASVFISSFCCAVVGYLCWVIIARSQSPLWVQLSGWESDWHITNIMAWNQFLNRNQPILFLLMQVLQRSLVSSLMILFSLVLSIWCKDRLIVLFLPLLQSYILKMAIYFSPESIYFLNPTYLMAGQSLDGISIGWVLVGYGLIGGLSLLFVFVRSAERRFSDE